MLAHPFWITIIISLLLSFARVIFIDKSFLSFISQFISLPYWCVIFVFAFIAILRSVRNSHYYRLLHTVYHEVHPDVRPDQLNFTQQVDEFGLT